jgi:hypothetical protein
MRKILVLACLTLYIGLGILAATPLAAQEPISFFPFRRVWNYHDFVVAEGLANRSWTWGPSAITPVIDEPYAESPTGTRQAQYFDKGRMELNDPNGSITDPWYVTTGLLPIELITGCVQTGDNRFEARAPTQASAIGDAGSFPMYADLAPFLNQPRSMPATRGEYVNALLTPGRVLPLPSAERSIPGARIVAEQNGFGIPQAFQEFMNQRGLISDGGMAFEGQVYDALYIFGLPVMQPFWVDTVVAGKAQRVLVQVFERRILTYTPANPDPWKVEMANVGRDYYNWRYNQQ